MLRNPHTTDTMFLTVTWKVLTPDMAKAKVKKSKHPPPSKGYIILSLKGEKVKMVNRGTPE